MTKTELIELVGAVVFRVWGVITFVNASVGLLTQTFNLYTFRGGGGFQMMSYGLISFTLSAIAAVLLFTFAVPLARNITKGISRVLDLPTSN